LKKIEFIPASEFAVSYVPRPIFSQSYIPQWFKDMSPFYKTNDTYPKRTTGKHCMPFFDAFGSGYIQELWSDVYISKEQNEIKINYANEWDRQIPNPITIRKFDGSNMPELLPKSEFYEDLELVWNGQWEALLPKGYSSLITHPLNRYDLPFFTLSGIIDADNFAMPGNVPFFIKKGFTGLIPAGTPIYQIIPIKRDSWQSFETKQSFSSIRKKYHPVRTKFNHGYKKLFWQKKIYR
jgi:hypothetical protein